jgi:hypothetical protein
MTRTLLEVSGSCLTAQQVAMPTNCTQSLKVLNMYIHDMRLQDPAVSEVRRNLGGVGNPFQVLQLERDGAEDEQKFCGGLSVDGNVANQRRIKASGAFLYLGSELHHEHV